ncbi:MAG: glycosyltransferase [Woeseiaceae bacterium]|nr:glycosyltransferase [Woeseiaceae bacterium]
MPDDKPHYLIVSYHFRPSSAVGARRPTALKSFLEANGARVSVMRGVESGVDAAGDEATDLSVVFPKKRLSATWRALKARRRGNGPMGPMAPATVQATNAERDIAWIRDGLRAWNSYLQSDKLWLARFAWKLRGLPRSTRYSAIIASGPPLASYVAGLMAAERFAAPLVLDFRDPWFLHREFPRGTHPAHAYFGGREDRLGQRCIDRASLLVAASPGIADHLTRTYSVGSTPLTIVRNGYDEESIIDSAAPTGRLEMIYAGTLYYNRNPFPFLEALARFVTSDGIERDRMRFRLVGKCDRWNGLSVAAWIEEQGLGDVVSVNGLVPHDKLTKLIEASNVLVNFSQGQPLQIPAKSYEYLASKRDVFCIAESDSDVARLHEEAGYGDVVAPNDGDAMRETLARLYRKYVAQPGAGDALPDTSRYRRSAQFRELLPALAAVDDT